MRLGSGCTEVDQYRFRFAVSVEANEDVCWFDVSMSDAELMYVTESFEHAEQECEPPAQRK
jgi:hypothetical protein